MHQVMNGWTTLSAVYVALTALLSLLLLPPAISAVTSPPTSKPISSILSPSAPTTPLTPHTPTNVLANHIPRTVLQYPTSDSVVMATPAGPAQYMIASQQNGSEVMPVQGWVIQHPTPVDNTGVCVCVCACVCVCVCCR